MAPKPDKSKGKGKAQSKGKDDGGSAAGGSGKLKAAQSINVRHILVGLFDSHRLPLGRASLASLLSLSAMILCDCNKKSPRL
jgi:hypothetical protein